MIKGSRSSDSSEWKRLLWVSRIAIVVALVLMIVTLFLPAFVIEQKMESHENPERYTHQTNGFTPWGYNTDIETTVHNETGSENDTGLQESSVFSTYSKNWLNAIPVAAATLVFLGLLGSVLLCGLLIVHRPGNKKRDLYTYLLFWPVALSCILLAAMFFFLIPRVIDQEMNLPEAYEPDMPIPSFGSEDGDLSAIGYGSDLYDRRPVGDNDNYTYNIKWSPGISMYLYVASFIFSFFGLLFYSKMRNLKGYIDAGSGEEDAEVEDMKLIVIGEYEESEDSSNLQDQDLKEVEVEDAEVEEVTMEDEVVEVEEPKVDGEERDTGSAPDKILMEPTLISDKTEGVSDNGSIFDAPMSSSPEIEIQEPKEPEIPIGSPEPEVEKDTPEPEATPKMKTPSKVSIIELGAEDFRDTTPLTIEGVDDVATVECPGCAMAFKTALGGTIRCPFCGLEGDAG